MKQKLLITTDEKKVIGRSGRGDFFKAKSVRLYLEDGVAFEGLAPAWQVGDYPGEVVFNTGMTGYVESLTDPSYSGQILVFTYPLIGNYGVQLDDAESARVQVNGVIVSQAATNWSHARGQCSLLEWLEKQGVPILMGVDTRALTKHLRSHGTMMGSIGLNRPAAGSFKAIGRQNSLLEPIIHNRQFSKKIILVDCGAKGNILRSLLKLPLQVKQVPLDYDYTLEDYDGVLLSNGPGDPTDYPETIAITRKALKLDKPIFGICLGSQVMGLAAGAKTYKLPFGHRGHNQPCIESSSEKCYITSQNHSYAIEEASLPNGWEVYYRNLNDGSIEGIQHKTKPFFSVQFHPEACPGPTDTNWLFERFHAAV